MSDRLVIAGTIALGTIALGLFGFVAWVLATYEPDAEVARRRDPYTLVGINPPKHFYVDLRDARGELREKVYVSKHCNTWRSLVIGQTLNLDVVTYRRPPDRGGKTYEVIETGGNAVCPRG